MTKELKKVTLDSVKTVHEGKFMAMKEATYTREGCEPAVWEYKHVTHDSVHVLVYNKDKGTFLFVEQVRIPLLERDIVENGITVECCAGIIDKYEDIDNIIDRAKEIAVDEIREELGYKVEGQAIKYIKPVITPEGAIKHLCFAIVTEEGNVGQSEGATEDIKIREVPMNKLYDLTCTENIDLITYSLTNMILLDSVAGSNMDELPLKK